MWPCEVSFPKILLTHGNAASRLVKYPLKFAAAVRNCIWRLCRTGVNVMTMTTRLTIILETTCLHSHTA